MHSIGMEDVWSAIPIMLGLSVIMVSIVVLAMWWVFNVFKEKEVLEDNSNEKTNGNEKTTK